MDRDELRQRALDRGRAVWCDLDIDGLTTGDATLESQINQLGRDGARAAVMIMDASAEYEAFNRDKLHALDLYGVEQSRRLAYEKVVTQRQILTLKTAGDLLIIAAKEYDAQIAMLIMEARRAAEEMGRSKVDIARERALMDQKKELAHLRQTEAAISVELVTQQTVQVDIARARLDAAKAVVKALTADVEVQQTELRVVQSGLELVSTEVERATLTADIAGIYADIVTRGLAAIRYEVDRAEIEQAASVVAQKLADMLEVWGARNELEEVKRQYDLMFRTEDEQQNQHQRREAWLSQFNQDLQEQVFAAERRVMEAHQECELAMKDVVEAKRRYTKEVEARAGVAMFAMNQSAEAVLQSARSAVEQYTRFEEVSVSRTGRVIHEGLFIVGGLGGGTGSVGVPTSAPIGNVPDATLPECD